MLIAEKFGKYSDNVRSSEDVLTSYLLELYLFGNNCEKNIFKKFLKIKSKSNLKGIYPWPKINSIHEPDIIIDIDKDNIMLIEVKYLSEEGKDKDKNKIDEDKINQLKRYLELFSKPKDTYLTGINILKNNGKKDEIELKNKTLLFRYLTAHFSEPKEFKDIENDNSFENIHMNWISWRELADKKIEKHLKNDETKYFDFLIDILWNRRNLVPFPHWINKLENLKELNLRNNK